MYLILSSIFLIFIVVSLHSVGFFFLKSKLSTNTSISVYSLFGLSLLTIFSHFAFYIFDFSSLQIAISFFFLASLLIFLNFFSKKDFYLSIKKIILISLPIITFFLFLAFLYEEQFYVFRGNKWDWFAFVTSSFYLNNLDTHDFLNLKNNFNWDSFKDFNPDEYSAYHKNIQIWLFKLVNINLLGSLFLNLKFNSPFLNLYLFKIFSLILINLSILDFLKKHLLNKKFFSIYLISLVFCSSFWIIYILEADYYRQLISFGFFIYLLTYIDEFLIDLYEKNYLKSSICITFCYFLFLIYPELLFIYLLILIIHFIKFDKKIKLISLNLNFFIYILFGLFLLISPSYELILNQIMGQIGSTTGENRWWTYFGAFLFGKSSPALDIDFANYVKNLIYNNANVSGQLDNVSFKDIIFIITSSISKFNYESVYLSIIPSFSGFYFITDLFKFEKLEIINLLFLFMFNIYLLVHLSKNLFLVLLSRNNELVHIKISLLFFILLSLYFIFLGKLWTFIKLYMYLSPIIFLVVMFNFLKNKNKIILSPNRFLFLIMICFIFYKFQINNFGIGSYDSFPSVQNINMKKNIVWKFDIEKFKECNKIKYKFKRWNYYDPETIPQNFKSIYLTIHLLDNGFYFNDNLTLKNKFNKKSKKVCEISDL